MVMVSNSLISVIIPAYNAEKYIEAAIISVLKQSDQNFEIIVVDDGSSDKTVNCVQGLQQTDQRIQMIQKNKNEGVSAARNLGVKNAKGKWIAFLDSDDLWAVEKLQKQRRLAKKTGGQFLFTGSGFVDKDHKFLSFCLSVPEKIERRELLKQNVISCSSVLVSKELIQKYPMSYGDFHEDFVVWLNLLQEETYAYAVNEPLLIYRIHSASKSRNKYKAAMMTYRVYKAAGLNTGAAIYYWLHYVVRSLKKYSKLRF